MLQENEFNNKLCCKICNKEYASQSSLCNHNKKFHKRVKPCITTNFDYTFNDTVLYNHLCK